MFSLSSRDAMLGALAAEASGQQSSSERKLSISVWLNVCLRRELDIRDISIRSSMASYSEVTFLLFSRLFHFPLLATVEVSRANG